MLSFSQINLHKAAQATLLVGQGLGGSKQTVVLVTEPHTNYNKITGMPKGTKAVFARQKDNDPPPRAGIIASTDTSLTAMEGWCNRDCAVALARIKGNQTVLVSLYLDINLDVQPAWLDDLMEMIDAKKYPVIMGVDSNAHSGLYGVDSNARGNAFEDFVLQYGLRVENIGTTPTFEVRRGDKLIQTHIDVTLTRGLPSGVINWRVDRKYNASDHNTIYFEVENNKLEPTLIRPWSKTDWELFSKTLADEKYDIPKGMSMKKLDKLVTKTYKAIDAALDKACPMMKFTPTVSMCGWATDKHAKGKNRVSELYRQAKKTECQRDWDKYKLADREFKKTCRNDRNKAWRKYKESIQSEKEMAQLAKSAQWEERRDINVLTRPDGSSTDPGAETIDLLTETHFPAATDTKHVTYNNRRNLSVEEIQCKYKDWIDKQKIKSALAGFEKKKSPGPDGIKPLIFEHLPDELITVLEIIYKSAIHLGYTPKAWKKTKVIFISKPGKDKYDKPKSFRPISLSNYLLKGLERLVGWRMDKALLAHPLHHKQHGFLTGKSTESAISNTVNYIERHIMQKQHCVGVFLDISAAFDSIKPCHVRQALLKHGGDPEMVQWYYNYIGHRDIIVDMHGNRASFSTGIGFPQGGVCSAKFWLIAFDYAIKIINRHNIEGNGYADDCSALYGGPRLDHAIAQLQKMLDELTAWGKTCGLSFNPEKSVAVVFSRRHKIPPRKLVIDGKEIEYQTEVRYLGITLDRKLHWAKHIDDKIGKAKRFLHNVANITRKNWGPKPKLMRWAYLGVVRPMLCYGSMIWGHRAPEQEDKLRRVNRMAMNTFASYPKSTPTRALEIILDVMPLHLHCRAEGLAARVRLDSVLEFGWDGQNKKKTHSQSHLRHWQLMLEAHNINVNHSDQCNLVYWNTLYRVCRDSFSGAAKFRTPTQYNVFTDGSRKEEQTGAGFVIYEGSRELETGNYRLPDHATVFQAEITAVAMAARKLRELQTGKMKYIKIFVDSQAALLALGNPMVRSKAVACAIEALNTLAAMVTSVVLLWIPAHKGHIGNERADTLAKLGSAVTDASLAITVGKSPAVTKMELKTGVYNDWAKEWAAYPLAQHSKGFYAFPNALKAKYAYKLARLELGRLVRAVTGHNNLNYFQTKLGLHHNSRCRFCEQADETFIHILQECPCFWHTRRDCFAGTLPTPGGRWSIRDLLDFTYTPKINEAFEGVWTSSDPVNQDNMICLLYTSPSPRDRQKSRMPSSA